MASYTYTGAEVREFPTLVLTVNPGDTFEAPDDFVSADVVPAAAPKKAASVAASTPSASSDSTQGA
jgi:hypothetical protein